jgi:FAD/FMN-containing dehydrogenase
VVEAVNFARDNGIKVVVRGGGHTWCGLAVRNGGMTIDLRALNESRIDESTRTAVIQPVISNRELARRLGEHGLAFPVGHCPTVKAGGYLLNGGMSRSLLGGQRMRTRHVRRGDAFSFEMLSLAQGNHHEHVLLFAQRFEGGRR